MGRALPDGCPSCRLDREIQTSGETNRAERPEAVLPHPLGRGAHGTHDTAIEVILSAERVVETLGLRRICDGVDREIPPRQILVERRSEGHLGMPAVSSHVATECRDLVEHAGVIEHADRPELDAHRDGALAAEDIPDVVWCRVSREVPIQVLMPQQRIPNGAADAPCLKPGLFELPGDVEHGLRRTQFLSFLEIVQGASSRLFIWRYFVAL